MTRFDAFLDTWNESNKSSSNIVFFFPLLFQRKVDRRRLISRPWRVDGKPDEGSIEENASRVFFLPDTMISYECKFQCLTCEIHSALERASLPRYERNDTRVILPRLSISMGNRCVNRWCSSHRVRSYFHRARLRDITASISSLRPSFTIVFYFSIFSLLFQPSLSKYFSS